VEYQVADSHAPGLGHSGRFRPPSHPNQVEFGTGGMARPGRGSLIQDDKLRSAVQEKAEDRAAVDSDFKDQPCWRRGMDDERTELQCVDLIVGYACTRIANPTRRILAPKRRSTLQRHNKYVTNV
jgi:hypothetical protein